jgi:hypothetical protein
LPVPLKPIRVIRSTLPTCTSASTAVFATDQYSQGRNGSLPDHGKGQV